jgi:hypothetical protein
MTKPVNVEGPGHPAATLEIPLVSFTMTLTLDTLEQFYLV